MARDKLIQLRRDTAANWTSVNPVLASGEAGLETDTLKLKIGNGATAWASLAYAVDLSGYSPTSHNHTGVYDPAGTAASAVSAHAIATDPHGDRAFATSAASTAQSNAISTASGDATTKANAAQAAAIAASTPAAHAGAGGAAHADAIAAGASGFMSGADKTKLDGIATGAQVNPTNTDGLSEGSTNLYHTAARVLGQVLTGLSTAAGTVVTSAHTVLQAIGFLQKQVSDNTTAISGKAATGAIGSSGLTMATNKLLGRNTAATGAIEEITLGTNLSMTGTTLNAAGGAVSAVDVELSPPTVVFGITNAQEGFELIEAVLSEFTPAFNAAMGGKLDLAGGTLTGPLEMVEVGTAPAAPGANTVSIYAEDNGSGKTRLMARFATGAPVQIAIEP